VDGVSGGVKARLFGEVIRRFETACCLRRRPTVLVGPTWTPYEEQICDDVTGHDEPTDRTGGGRSGILPAGKSFFRRGSTRSRALSPFSHPMMASTRRSSCYVHYVWGAQRNYAQSRSYIAGDTGAIVRRGSGAHADCFGNGDQTRAVIDAAPSARIEQSNSAGHDHTQCKVTPLRGTGHRESGGGSLAASDDAYLTRRQQRGIDTAFRRVCSDIAVPCPGQYASVLAIVKNPRALLAAATRRS
jgi:hypothetical protein